MEDSVALGEVVLSGEWEERPRKEVEVPIHPLSTQGRTGVSVHHRRGGYEERVIKEKLLTNQNWYTAQNSS